MIGRESLNFETDLISRKLCRIFLENFLIFLQFEFFYSVSFF